MRTILSWLSLGLLIVGVGCLIRGESFAAMGVFALAVIGFLTAGECEDYKD